MQCQQTHLTNYQVVKARATRHSHQVVKHGADGDDGEHVLMMSTVAKTIVVMMVMVVMLAMIRLRKSSCHTFVMMMTSCR